MDAQADADAQTDADAAAPMDSAPPVDSSPPDADAEPDAELVCGNDGDGIPCTVVADCPPSCDPERIAICPEVVCFYVLSSGD